MPNYSPTEQQLLIAFGLRLKAFRLDRQLSQEELAEATDLHRTYISSAERGERNVSLLNLNKLADALEIPVALLTTDEQIMNAAEYQAARQRLLENNCAELLSLEENITNALISSILPIASNIKSDFDSATNLKPFWDQYAPVQRGHRPRGEAYPWGEVGEKVVEGHLYSIMPQVFEGVRFLGVPYGHDIRFATNNAFIHIDAKSTGPTDNADEVVSSPNQVTGTGRLDQNGSVVNDVVQMRGPRVTRDFLPELAPFYIVNGTILPTLTFYLKIVYSVQALGEQPLEYLELICVPNGLALFDGPNLNANVAGLLTPGKDEVNVVRKRTRIKLSPLSELDTWRCQKIKFSNAGPYLEERRR